MSDAHADPGTEPVREGISKSGTAPALELPLGDSLYISPLLGPCEYEYLDHTADVQIHAWGRTLEDAFQNAGLALFNYMVPLQCVEVDESLTRSIAVGGQDLESLLFAFLDELLFVFSTELLVFKHIQIDQMSHSDWCITATGRGEVLDRSRHETGTEVKAITYSAMRIVEEAGRAHVFAIVDI